MSKIAWPLAVAADQFPDLPAITGAGGIISFLELDQRVRTAAETLAAAGVQLGSRVAIAGDASPAYVAAMLGCIRLGAAAVPLNTRWPEAAMAEAVSVLECHAVVRDANFNFNTTATALPMDAFNRCALKAQDTAPRIDPDQTAVILFTSGSGGSPKPAALTFGNLYFNARNSNRNIEVQPGDCWLLSLPLFHVSGLGVLFRCITGGGAMAIPASDETIPEACVQYRVTHLSLVATQLYRLIHSGSGLNALRKAQAILIGGSAIPESLIRSAVDHRLSIFTTYGMTETASQITTTRPKDSIEALLTCGRPLDPNAIKLAPDGEILVRGECLFKGYVDGPSTQLKLEEGTWFRTGDRGAFNAKGYLTVFGRKDNQFISGGENIQPEEIEQHLQLIEGIEQAIVVPVPDKEYGHRPVAFVKTASRSSVDAASIAYELSRVLPGYKVPRSYFPWPDHLPEGAMKVSRSKLRAIAEWLAQRAS